MSETEPQTAHAKEATPVQAFLVSLTIGTIGVFIVISGCRAKSQQPEEGRVVLKKVCDTEEERKNLADFILQCVEKASVATDEDPEDWVVQCEKSGRTTLCQETAYYDPSGLDKPAYPCSSATSEASKKECALYLSAKNPVQLPEW